MAKGDKSEFIMRRDGAVADVPEIWGMKKPGSGRVGFGGLEANGAAKRASPSPTRAPPPATLRGGGQRHGLDTKRHEITDAHFPGSCNREKLLRVISARHQLG